MITLKSINKYFESHKALDQVSLEIKKGSIFGIIGSSGAGKSTLLRCINLLEKPDSGQILINNQDITQFSKDELRKCRKKIGMIFQHFNLLSNKTVYQNIALPLSIQKMPKDEIKNTILPILKMTNIEDKIDKYPSQLSGGQKQRVAIARALVTEPTILLCDEATSALDPQTTKSILSLLKNINQRLSITIVLITHEMDVARAICDEVAVMASGKLIEKNTTEKIFLHPEEKITRGFVQSVTQESKALRNIKKITTLNDHPMQTLRLAFVGYKATAPIITSTAKKFGVDFNILHGDIETVNDKTMGFLLVQLLGSSEQQKSSIEYIESQDIKVEIINE